MFIYPQNEMPPHSAQPIRKLLKIDLHNRNEWPQTRKTDKHIVGIGIAMGFVASKKNTEYHQPYPLINAE